LIDCSVIHLTPFSTTLPSQYLQVLETLAIDIMMLGQSNRWIDSFLKHFNKHFLPDRAGAIRSYKVFLSHKKVSFLSKFLFLSRASSQDACSIDFVLFSLKHTQRLLSDRLALKPLKESTLHDNLKLLLRRLGNLFIFEVPDR
jgi:hypothetical protein